MRIKRIHINQHNIKWNNKHPGQEPKSVVTVKCGGKTYIGNSVLILGPSSVIYSPDKPLSCGAHVWVETTHPVLVDESSLT